jgi:CelD/BcsL family acetyltransferase involved in cellulose biosynthesis
MGGDASDYADVIVDPGARSLLMPMLRWLAADRRWDVLRLGHLLESSETAADIDGFFAAHGFATDRRPDAIAPTRLFGDRLADSRLLDKKSLKRHHNYFARTGRLEFETIADAPAIHARLEGFFRMHVERWAGTDAPSLFLDGRQRQFYRRMVTALAPAGWMRYSVVKFEGVPIAAHLGFEYGGRFVWYKPAFHVGYARHSPGEVLLRYLLGLALERSLAEFDFASGDEAFKRRFANHVRQTEVVHVFRHALPLRACRLWWGATAAMRRSDWIRRAGRRIVRRAGPEARPLRETRGTPTTS